MADVKWIKITTDILNDNKMKLIDSMPESDAIFRIWIGILSLAGQSNNQGMIYLSENMPYTDEMLSTIFNRPINTIRLALDVLQKFGMLEILENGILFISNWEKHQNLDKLEKIKEQGRLRSHKHREKAKMIGSNDAVTLRNATDKIRLDKTRSDKNKPYTDSFLDLWKVYPNTSGKKSCSMKYESLIKKGIDPNELLQATLNYAKTVIDKEMKFIKQGKTFFGPGEHWKEYLIEQDPDQKYTGPKTRPAIFDKNYFKSKAGE